MLNIEDLSSITLDDINSILKNHVGTDFEFISVQNCTYKNIIVGYMSNQERWSITYKTKNGEEKLNIFVKKIPPSGFQRAVVKEIATFTKEVQCYLTILKDFQKIIQEQPFPKFYHSRDDEIIVLEDLISEGFKIRDVFEPWDYDHCQVCLKALAKFHAGTFVTEARKGSTINKLYSDIINNETIFRTDEESPGHHWYAAGITAAEKIVETYLTNRYSKQVIENGKEIMSLMIKKFQPSTEYPNVLAHFDLWGNNIMYKYNENGKPSKARFLDFQMYRYVVPAFDILYFLHTTTTLSFRTKYLYVLGKLYYDSLSDELDSYRINIDAMLPWETYKCMMDDTLPTVLAMMPICMPFILLPKDHFKKVMGSEVEYKKLHGEDRHRVLFDVMTKNPLYKSRLLESISEFFDHVKTLRNKI